CPGNAQISALRLKEALGGFEIQSIGAISDDVEAEINAVEWGRFIVNDPAKLTLIQKRKIIGAGDGADARAAMTGQVSHSVADCARGANDQNTLTWLQFDDAQEV